MSRSGWTVSVSLALLVLSVVGALTRRLLLGSDIDGPRSNHAWKVTLVVSGTLGKGEVNLHTPVPLDFRRQHTILEEFNSNQMTAKRGKGKHKHTEEVIWQRTGVVGNFNFRLHLTCNCFLGMRRQTVAMADSTKELDAEPTGQTSLQATPAIERDDPEIDLLARHLAEGLADKPGDFARLCYDHVRQLDDEPFSTLRTAKETLRVGGAGSAGKSRLVVALLRNRGIPARVLTGLLLTADQEPRLHYWVEAWIEHKWFPIDPTQRHFGPVNWPQNYLILQLDDEPLLRGIKDRQAIQFGFRAENLQNVDSEEHEGAAILGRLWQHLTLHGLRPQEQHLVRFLLLLPLAALLVSLFRTVIGIPTFGTFTPALLGLAFLDMKALPVGLPIFVILILVGWGMRHLLDRFHLLQVPRASALLTLIVMLLLVLTFVANRFGLAVSQYTALYPLVILTHLVERFWTMEMEDGAYHSFRTLLGTMLVSVTTSVVLSPKILSDWMFRYPETLGVVLAVLLLLGRYTGYRLAELYRFGDLVRLVEQRQKAKVSAPVPVPLVAPLPVERPEPITMEKSSCSPGGNAGDGFANSASSG
jgi:hypothetical protein